jgi:L-aminopeptidase/D-esterase-like protein
VRRKALGVGGVRVGHWTDVVACTGCTVVLLPEGTVGSAEIRGGAPATRELGLLDPMASMQRLDAVVLTGGSAFGLASADGVMRWCEERGVGFPTSVGPVPIVAALGLFDLAEGDASVRPGPDAGYAACEAATAGPVELGRVGAGAGATVSKWRGRDRARPGGLGAAVVRHAGVSVAALVAVNATGDVPDGRARVLTRPEPDDAFANTTIGVVVTDARLTKLQCHGAARSGHDGFARALDPVHTAVDGDAVVVAATGAVEVDPEAVRSVTATAVERAIRTVVGGER